jgi:hypothetical protein
LTTIGFHAFDGCSALLKADLPDTVTTINPYAFANCTSLSSFTYPANWSVTLRTDVGVSNLVYNRFQYMIYNIQNTN